MIHKLFCNYYNIYIKANTSICILKLFQFIVIMISTSGNQNILVNRGFDKYITGIISPKIIKRLNSK